MIIGLITFMLIPASIAYAQLDPVEILATHTIYSKGTNYVPSSDFDVEFSKITGIFRIHGHVTTGDPYAVYLKQFDPDFKKVFFVKDGIFQKATLKEIITSSDDTTEPKKTIPTNIPILDFDYFISSPIQIQQDFTIKVNTYNAQKTSGLTKHLEPIQDVKFHIELAQERKEFVVVNERTSYEKIIENDWKVIKTIDGVVNSYGIWTGSTLLTSQTVNSDQWMKVTITATLGDQIVEKETKVFPSTFLY
jgi:hypothetical protein